MKVPISVKIINEEQIYIKYSDGLEGNISIKKSLNKNINQSTNIVINKDSKNIIINDVELCKDAIYKQLHLKNIASKLKLDIEKI